ncbi:MAG: sigma 54-interacting transcriptional regulator [Deltaproteobacteria bacterium]|jgi:arginine utilization regulatory protein|nr:sigma 54-interacting transcriptional regulator [Deltaproteobacteria bacterium]
MKDTELLTRLDDIDFLPVFDLSSDGIIIVDQNGIIKYYNKQIQKIDDLTSKDVLLKKVTEVYDLTEKDSKIMQCLTSQEPIIDEVFVYRTYTGKIVNSIHSVFPLYKNQILAGAACFIRDYKLLEDTLFIAASQNKKVHAPYSTNFTFADIIGKNPEFQDVINTAKIVSNTPSPVMLCGKTGTGKELFAKSIHNLSSRNKKRFTPVNCAAIPENLLEGILFGTSKGAFTGAIEKQGLFEATNGGTIFLDELNSMPNGLQAKILRVIQDKKIRRVGSLKEIALDLKVISSINEEPYKSISKGDLRPDLFYRLGVVFLKIPSLNERLDDIELLIQHFIKKHNKLLGKRIRSISPGVKQQLKEYDWPGNIRELEHVIEGAMNIIESGNVIENKHLKDNLSSFPDHTNDQIPARYIPEDRSTTTIKPRLYQKSRSSSISDIQEKELIQEILLQTKGNITKTAAKLGISRQLLYYKLKKYQLKR